MKESISGARVAPSTGKAGGASPSARLWRCIRLQKVWTLGLAALWMLALILSPIDPNYTSGELLDHAQAWQEGAPLYPSLEKAPYRVLNYPPLFLMATRGISSLGLPMKITGHFLVWASVLASACVLYRWLRSQGSTGPLSLTVLSFLGASYAALAHAALFHLQWTAVFLSLVGLFFLKKPERFFLSFLAGVLLALACFVKQTQILSVLIALVWLLRYERRHAPATLAGLLLTLLLGTMTAQFYFGPEIWRHLITYTVGSYSFLQGMREWTANALSWAFFAFLAFRWAFENSTHRRDLRTWYLAGTTLGLLTAARVGSGAQYFVEWNCALVLCVGGFLREKSETGPRWLLPLLLIQLIVADAVTGARLAADAFRLKHRLSILPALCAKISSASSSLIPIGEPGLARACGKGAALHPFIMAELSKKGLWNPSPFLKELKEGTYPVAILPFDPDLGPRGFDRERWTPEILAAFRSHYQVSEDERGWKVLEYVRRRE